jgi:hypothetical protein
MLVARQKMMQEPPELPVGFLMSVHVLGMLPKGRLARLQVVEGTTVQQFKAHLVQLGYWRRPELFSLAMADGEVITDTDTEVESDTTFVSLPNTPKVPGPTSFLPAWLDPSSSKLSSAGHSLVLSTPIDACRGCGQKFKTEKGLKYHTSYNICGKVLANVAKPKISYNKWTKKEHSLFVQGLRQWPRFDLDMFIQLLV